MIRAIAIDDEPLALQVLQHHAAMVNNVSIEHTFTNASEGLRYTHQHKPDVVFIDIKMPDHNGLDIAIALPPATHIIFTTAYSQYAIQGFDINAADYLLKPISFQRFVQACGKIEKLLTNISRSSVITVRENGCWIRIPLSHLLYIQAKGNYLHLVTTTSTHLIRNTLQEFASHLPHTFLRVHKSYIVNTAAVDVVENNQVIVSGHKVPVSAQLRSALLTSLHT
jgi:DNA-binding LytR/AlgR family response regulator